MTKPPLLPSLGFIAVAGAVWFLTATLPSPGPHPFSQAEQATGDSQHRAVEAVMRAGPEAPRSLDEAAGKAARSATANSSAGEEAPPPHQRPPMTTAQSGRVKAAQREFLLHPENWIAEKAQELEAVARPYQWNRVKWMEQILTTEWTDLSVVGGSGVLEYRRKVDALCADLTKLSPAAKKQWDEWEAKDWEGWKPPVPEESLPHTTPEENAAADFLSRRTSRARPLLDEYEYLEDLPQQINARGLILTTAPNAAADAEFYQRMELVAAEAQMNRVRDELTALADDTAAAQQQWEEKGWTGYAPEIAAESTGN